MTRARRPCSTSSRTGRGRQILTRRARPRGRCGASFSLSRQPASPTEPPLDPNSTGPSSAPKALVLLLREGGADVSGVGAAAPAGSGVTSGRSARHVRRRPPRRDHAPGSRRAARCWSPTPAPTWPQAQVYFSPVNGGYLRQRAPRRVLARFPPSVMSTRSLDASPRRLFKPPTGAKPARTCFDQDDGSFLVATDVGEGTVVAVGGAAVFTNERPRRGRTTPSWPTPSSQPRGGDKRRRAQ